MSYLRNVLVVTRCEPEELPDLSAVFSALANPDRLAILRAVADDPPAEKRGEMTISEVARRVELSRFTTSRHLRILHQAGLLQATKIGNMVIHRISHTGIHRIEDWLAEIPSPQESGTHC